MVICLSDGTYNHLTYFDKNQSIRSKPKDMVLALDVITPKPPCLSRCHRTNIDELSVNSSKINFVVTCIADCTCHHLTNSRKKLKFLAELRNSNQIREFSNRKCGLSWYFIGFFSFLSKEISIRGYMSL